MARQAAMVTDQQVHPFRQAFPRIAFVVLFTVACVKVAAVLVRVAFRYRVELVAAALFGWLWATVSGWVGNPRTALWYLVVPLAVVGVVFALPACPRRLARLLRATRYTRWLVHVLGLRIRLATLLGRHWSGRPVLWLLGSFSRARTRRRLYAGMRELRVANTSRQLPRIRWTASTAVGERVTLACRPGQSAELLDVRAEELRAAAKARDVRINRNPNRSHLVYVDVVRRDPLAASTNIRWADAEADQPSMWDPVHFGTDENGADVRIELAERSIFLAGEPGSGKSSGEQVILGHAAKSPDAHLILIDPNRVQFSPWKDRALAFAADDPAEAVGVLELVQAEIARRLALFERLPGVVRKLTRDIAEAEGLPLWVVMIDELAYHTSVVGTPTGPFAKAARDIVARGRAAGIIPVFATQRPTSDVVPTSLRDLFSMRCAFRCTTHASSDVILGEGWARRGYSAVDIDLRARGVSWLLAEGHVPRRMKWAWNDDTAIGDLAVTTIRYRPDAPTWLTERLTAPDAPAEAAEAAPKPRQRRRRTSTDPGDTTAD